MAAEQSSKTAPTSWKSRSRPGPRLGEMVVEAVNLGKSYGDRVIFENVNFRLPPGGIVGIIGPNGAGKTTLLRMLMGQETPDDGELKIGPTVESRLRRPKPRLARRRQNRLRGNLRRVRQSRHGRPQDSTRGPTSRGSISSGPTSRRRSASSRAASGTGSTWPSCCAAGRTCCCWTNRRTTSTSTRCGP